MALKSKNRFYFTAKEGASTLAGIALIVAAFGLSTPVHADATELVVVSWGGAYSAAQQKAFHDPYMAINPNIKIINDDSGTESLAKLRAQQETGNIGWDLIDVDATDAVRMCDEGLVEIIDPNKDLAMAPDGTTASEDFGNFLVSECVFPNVVYATTLAYRTDLVKQAPTSMCDMFDLENIPGKRALEKQPINNFEWALLCDGVPSEEIYDVLSTSEGVERALAKLDTIKNEVIWWTTGAQTPQLLADGEIVLGSGWNGRLFSLIEEENQPVAMLWDWQVLDSGGWVIPKGTQHLEKVKKYVKWATDTQRLADLTKYISYGPTRTSSLPLVGKHAELGIDMLPHMPTYPDNAKRFLLYNYEWWADHRDELDQRFQAWLIK